MTLQELKKAIIEDETEFIVEMYEDVNAEPSEIEEAVDDIISEVNSYQTVDELIYFYVSRGYSEQDACRNLFHYLVEN